MDNSCKKLSANNKLFKIDSSILILSEKNFKLKFLNFFGLAFFKCLIFVLYSGNSTLFKFFKTFILSAIEYSTNSNLQSL